MTLQLCIRFPHWGYITIGEEQFVKVLYNLCMSLTALDLPSHELRKYHPLSAIQRRTAVKSAELAKRRRRAVITARKAAELLRREFGAGSVFLFGSITRRGSFTLWSDIDIAVQGILPTQFFEAVGAVTGLSAEFKIDLIDLETCPAAMRETIEAEGRAL
jgi:predicted nucleotidyltransferase